MAPSNVSPVLVALLCILPTVQTSPALNRTTTSIVQRVKVAVYGEALCPDTTRFLNDQLAPFWHEASLRAIANTEVFPFGFAHCSYNGTDDYNCSCQHGPEECLMNQLMNCAIALLDRQEIYMPVLFCLQQLNISQARPCFDKRNLTGNYANLYRCATSKQGRYLLHQTGLESPANMTYVPWIEVNGQRSKRAELAFKSVVCNSYEGTKPDSCTDKAPSFGHHFSLNLLLFVILKAICNCN